jgi:hypothetical protein
LESDHTRLAPWPGVGGSSTVAFPLSGSMAAMWLPASEAYQTSPSGVVVMPYGPGPRGASKTRTRPPRGSTLP